MSRFLYWLTLLLLALLPFEVLQPLFTGAGLQITNLELLVGVVSAAGSLLLLRAWRAGALPPAPPRLLLWPAGILLLVSLLSAVLAPTFQAEALKSVARLAFGLLLFVLVAAQARDKRVARAFMWAVVVGAAVSALFGLSELAAWEPLDAFLMLFKAGPTYVGPARRVSASFQYATIATMYWEMALPVALSLAVVSRSRRISGVALGLALLLAITSLFTLTRASLLTLFALFVGLVLLGWHCDFYRPFVRPIGLLTLVLAGVFGLLVWQSNGFRLRLTTENDLNWYAADYDVPEQLELESGRPAPVFVRLHNTGRVHWQGKDGEHPVLLRYRWLTSDGQAVYLLPEQTIPMPHPIEPGESLLLELTLAPELPAGEYRLAWGLLQQERLPFYGRGVPEAESRVRLESGRHAISLPETRPRTLFDLDARVAEVPTRRELWLAAYRMGISRPLIGFGPNNFRHLYGSYLGHETWDTRVSANNLYLELWADGGLVGVLSFAGLFGGAFLTGLRLLRQERRPESLWVAGLLGALLAVGAHGFLDYFFEFLGVQLLFWVVLGLLGGLLAQSESAINDPEEAVSPVLPERQ